MLPVLGISMGDPAGIGAEIAVKALAKNDWTQKCVPVVIGDAAAMADAISFTGCDCRLNKIEDPSQAVNEPGVINLIDLGFLTPHSWEYKKVSALAGKAAFHYVREATELAMQGKTDAIVTGPINKEAINLAGYHYSGHTEILADLTGTKDYAMLLTGGNLRVIHVTTHVSMREACDRITKQRVYTVIKLARQAMELLGMPDAKIGVAGFNAHCSENGLFGDEEARAIIPAIEQAQAEGINVDGPVPPDTVFVKAQAGQYGIVVAMYHDQGHIPLKVVGFVYNKARGAWDAVEGVNVTLGLPIIRVSVDHGTGFGHAGQGTANELSLDHAIAYAVQLAVFRSKHPQQ